MSQIIKMWIAGLLIISGSLIVGGCGSSTPNAKSPFDADAQTHVANWVPAGHRVIAQEDLNSCTECHGSDLTGGISGVACSDCHINVSPFVLTGCVSCHGKPPTGTTAPNRSGAHAAHNALPNVTDVCDTCHSGAGSGTTKHDNDVVDVAFLNVYNAKSGSAVRNSDGSCSKVSCHGGQTTPAWLSGATIDVSSQCTVCHAFGTAEYNSFSSGQHDFHVNTRSILCISCHDTAKLPTVHFTSLNTTTLDGLAYTTLLNSLNYIKAAGTCDAPCHPGVRTW